MAVTGIHSLAKLHCQIPRFATTGITLWQTALKCTADCQAPRSGGKEYMRPVRPVAIYSQILTPVCGNPQYGYFIVAIHILHIGDCHDPWYTFEYSAELSKWVRYSSRHYTLTAPCLLRHKLLTHDFLRVRQICGKLLRPKLYTNILSCQTISWMWYYPFKLLTQIKYQHCIKVIISALL
jgi:hypothetical protein